MNPHLMARLRIGLLIFVAILIQTSVGSDLRVYRVAPDLMVLLAVCAGMAGGTEAGAWVGFWAGLTADMFLTATPVGLSALTYCVIGGGIGALRATVLQENRVLLPLAAFTGTVAAVLVFVAVGDLFGQSQLLASGRSWLITVALVEGGWNALLVLPVAFLYAWVARGSVGVENLRTGPGGGRDERVAA
jgi:rod shape-determining protein MreD